MFFCCRKLFCLAPSSPQCLSIIPIVSVLLCLDKHQSRGGFTMQTPPNGMRLLFKFTFPVADTLKKTVERASFFIGTADDGGSLVNLSVRPSVDM